MIALQQELYTTGVSSTLWCNFYPLTHSYLPDSIRGAPQDGEHSWKQPSDDKTKNPKILDTCPFLTLQVMLCLNPLPSRRGVKISFKNIEAS